MENLIRKGAELVQGAKKILVFTGAGLSTESGIPDFRSPGGIWERYDPEDFYYHKIVSDQRARENYWRMSTEFYETMKSASPNAAHMAVKEMEDMGKILAVVHPEHRHPPSAGRVQPGEGHRDPRDRLLGLLPPLREEI